MATKNIFKGSDPGLQDLIPKIELVDPHSIEPNPANPRTLTTKAFNELVKSVDSFYQMLLLRPIIVDDEGIAIGGSQRLLASRKAGFSLVPIIRASQLTVRQRREFILKDNVHAGAWNMDALANDWDAKDLNDWGFKVEDLTTNTTKARQVSFTAKEKEPSFDISIKCDTELQRQEMITRLEAAGLESGRDYFTD